MLQVYARSNLEGDCPPPTSDRLWRKHPKDDEGKLDWVDYKALEAIDYDDMDVFGLTDDPKELSAEDNQAQIDTFAGGPFHGFDHDDAEYEDGGDGIFKIDKSEYRKRLSIHDLPDPVEMKETLQRRNIKESMALFQQMKKVMVGP